MSKPISPTAIGGFSVGALVLLVVGLLLFGGGQFFNNDKSRFVIYFDSSLNGLDVGAPVKMQGVKIGSVTEIVLDVDSRTGKVYKPVVIELDRKSFLGANNQGRLTRSEQEKNRDKLVAAGFRARLETQSLLTGLLYIDFDVHKDQPAHYVGLGYKGLLEIPAVPTTADQLRNAAEVIAKKVSALPLEEIVRDLASSIKEIRDILASDETKKTRDSLAKTLAGTEKTIATLNRNLEPLLKDTAKTMVSTNALVADSRKMLQDIHREVGPVLSAAAAALNQSQAALTQVGDAVGPDSDLNAMLHSLNDAARSVKELADYLERHPEALLSGKEK
jgi:paraquat-inducible protein B